MLRRALATASGFTDTDVMPNRTRCSANSGLFDGAWPQSDEVIPAAGSTHSALRIAPSRLAELVEAKWVDVSQQPAAEGTS